MENNTVKCDIFKCEGIRFLEIRLKEHALNTFRKEHCESEKYKECLYYSERHKSFPNKPTTNMGIINVVGYIKKKLK